MKPTPEQLTAALRAASAAIPGGPAIVYVIVVTEHEHHSVISSASNVHSIETKRRVLELERRNLAAEPGARIARGGE